MPTRRHILAAAPAALALPRAARAGSRAFDETTLAALAKALAARPHAPAPDVLPPALADLDYDGYRALAFDPDQALWKAQDLPFRVQLFHRGGLFRRKVELFEIVDGRAAPIAYSPDLFQFNGSPPPGLGPDLGFAGFRIHAPINRPNVWDEVCVFLGASYFRAVAKDMFYGLSARGLAIDSGGPEEFPDFRAFWIERPKPGATSVAVMALLDGPSITGAFRFVVTPGVTTTFDVTASLFPRRAIANIGIAPLTSMFLFSGDARRPFLDFRPQVHDSDGLSIARRSGERVWRPLVNPLSAQISPFPETSPRGFGLLQRERRYDAYEDLEARYEGRPSAFVEIRGDWGEGEVRLVELATLAEYEDNVVAFWTPKGGVAPGQPLRLSYRIDWGPEPATPGIARIVQSRGGASFGARRRFVLDYDRPFSATLEPRFTASMGQIIQAALRSNPQTGGVRLSFDLDPGEAKAADLTGVLLDAGRPCSEIWRYRWQA